MLAPRRRLTPEKKLIAYVIARAGHDARGFVDSDALQQEACEWILSDDDSEFSFNWCAEALRLSWRTVSFFKTLAANPPRVYSRRRKKCENFTTYDLWEA